MELKQFICIYLALGISWALLNISASFGMIKAIRVNLIPDNPKDGPKRKGKLNQLLKSMTHDLGTIESIWGRKVAVAFLALLLTFTFIVDLVFWPRSVYRKIKARKNRHL